MLPGALDWTAYSNAAFQESLQYADSSGNLINLTGYTARMSIGNMYGAGATIYYTLTTSNGGIVLGDGSDPTAANITLYIPQSEMASIPTGVYDLILIEPDMADDPESLLRGNFNVFPGLTAP